jgi:hypothetical protein
MRLSWNETHGGRRGSPLPAGSLRHDEAQALGSLKSRQIQRALARELPSVEMDRPIEA